MSSKEITEALAILVGCLVKWATCGFTIVIGAVLLSALFYLITNAHFAVSSAL